MANSTAIQMMTAAFPAVPGPPAAAGEVSVAAAAAAPANGESRAILFATPTCPNCRLACSYMDKAGFKYEKLMAEDNAELVKQYGVKQAPTLVVTKNGGFEKYAGAGAIRSYISQ